MTFSACFHGRLHEVIDLVSHHPKIRPVRVFEVARNLVVRAFVERFGVQEKGDGKARFAATFPSCSAIAGRALWLSRTRGLRSSILWMVRQISTRFVRRIARFAMRLRDRLAGRWCSWGTGFAGAGWCARAGEETSSSVLRSVSDGFCA